MSFIIKIGVFILFLIVFGIWTLVLSVLTKKIINDAVYGKSFWNNQFFLLLSGGGFFLLIYLLSGFFSLPLAILVLVSSELGMIASIILWGFLGSTSVKWGPQSMLAGREFGIKHPSLTIFMIILTFLIILGYIILAGIAYFTLPSKELTTHIFQYTLIGLFISNYPMMITYLIGILVSENLEEETRMHFLVNQLGGLIPTALYIALTFWAFGLAGSETTFSISYFSIKLSAQLILFLIGFFLFIVLLPYLIGTQRAKKWRVVLLEKQIIWADKFLDILDLPIHSLYIPKLTQFRYDLDNEIKKFLSEDRTISKDAQFEDLYLFCWDKIPGDDTDRFKEFLIRKYGINWVKTTEFNKTDNDMTINVSYEMNSLSLKLNNEKTKAILTIGDGRTEDFIATVESDKLKIYPQEIQSILFTAYLESRDIDPRFKYLDKLRQFSTEVREIINELEQRNDEEMEKIAEGCAKTYHTRKDEIAKEIETTKTTKSSIWIGIAGIVTLVGSAILSKIGRAHV
jgi:hypothetical protein